MSEQNPYAPGVYVKGDDKRVAGSAADAVALSFDGYVRQPDPEPEPELDEVPDPDPVPVPTPPRDRRNDVVADPTKDKS
jgi:hypothetical protein